MDIPLPAPFTYIAIFKLCQLFKIQRIHIQLFVKYVFCEEFLVEINCNFFEAFSFHRDFIVTNVIIFHPEI